MLSNESQVGGNIFFVRDSYVWAAIYYLDSPTGYREYLPQYSSIPKLDSELLILDSCSKGISGFNAQWVVSALLAAFFCLALLLLVCLSS
jgi:hypothetical protein